MMRAKPLMILRLACATSAAASSTSSFGKIKVLCLHGYSQNAAIFRDRSGGFRKPFKKNVFEMHYAEGPFGCTAKGEDPAIADADLTQRAWWRGHSGMETYDGWAETRANLAEVWREEQFDGIIGFSQGAAAAAMLAAELRPRFAIFVSGFVPRDADAASSLLEGVKGVPSLHVYGSADELVVPERSRALSELFADATILEHPGGHMTPSGAPIRAQVKEFLSANLGV